jgi:WD40 repeat protein
MSLTVSSLFGIFTSSSAQNLYSTPRYAPFSCITRLTTAHTKLQSDVLAVTFSPFHPNLIFGGTYSGQILLWDTRSKHLPVLKTPLSATGHTHPVYALRVVGTQNAHNLVTCSSDGTVCTWLVDMLAQPQVGTRIAGPPTPNRTNRDTGNTGTTSARAQQDKRSSHHHPRLPSQRNLYLLGWDRGRKYLPSTSVRPSWRQGRSKPTRSIQRPPWASPRTEFPPFKWTCRLLRPLPSIQFGRLDSEVVACSIGGEA